MKPHHQKVMEDLQSIDESSLELEHPKTHPILKKIIFTLSSVIISLLMLSFIFVSFPIGNIILGQIESTPLQSNTLKIDSLTIQFQDQTLKQLQSIYNNQQKVEFSVCLQGTKQDSNYFITSLYEPKMYQQTFNHVTFEPCNQNTLIMLHSHPYKSCLASDTDLNTLKQTQKNNPDTLMIIMCEPQRFSIYK